MKTMKRLLAIVLTISTLFICSVSGAAAWQNVDTSSGTNSASASDKISQLLEGIFDGTTLEIEDPARDHAGYVDLNQNGTIDDAGDIKMHFPDFVTVDGVIYAYFIQWNDHNGDWENEKSCVGLATSTDGIHFESKGVVIYPDEATGYDGYMASFPGVWYEDGVWYVAYECNQDGNNGDIALATSTNGIDFEKKGLILRHNPRWNWQNWNIGTPDLYKEGDVWYLTFHGFGREKKDCQIGLATGTDIMNLTMQTEPVLPTSDDPAACDSGTAGRRDIIKAGEYYYMCYEVSSDGGANGRPYYDFSGSRWGHAFARSKDFITWEKAPAQLHASTEENYAFDGPAWLPIGDRLWLYYRTPQTTTNAFELIRYDTVTDEETGISVEINNSQTLHISEITEGETFETVSSLVDPKMIFTIYDLSLEKDGQIVDPLKTAAVSIPLPQKVFSDEATLYKFNSTHTLEKVTTELSENTFEFSTDVLGVYVIEAAPILFGDVNRDKTVTTGDALLALQTAVKKIKLDEKQYLLADVNGDHTITTSDALSILQKAVGKIDQFEIEKTV